MTSEHERQMQQANERASNSRKQATALQSQLSMIQYVVVINRCEYEQAVSMICV